MSKPILKKNRFTISDINVITSWRHNLELNTECTICRCNLHENSLSYQSKGLSSYIIVGECGHSFHKECLEGWIKENARCPICACKWKYKT